MLRTAEKQETANLRVDEQCKKPVIRSVKDFRPETTLPTVNPDELLEKKVFMTEHAGHMQRTEVTEHMESDSKEVANADSHDEQHTYAELINLLHKETEKSKSVFGLSAKHSTIYRVKKEKGHKQFMEVLVKWETGKPTWKALCLPWGKMIL